MKLRALFATALLVTAGCEYMPFAGGPLDGTPAPSPADWRTLGDVDIVQLETLREGEPYSVNIWMIAEETHLYVYGGENYAQWAENMDAADAARMKIEGAVYELRGARVSDEEEFARFARAWLAKYGSDRTDSTAADTYLYRLVARDG